MSTYKVYRVVGGTTWAIDPQWYVTDLPDYRGGHEAF